MSCLGPYYLPVPPRVWSRVENPCAYTNSATIQNIPGDYIYLPYLKDPILKSQYYFQLECLKKGNVLQYKANSSNLTKQQRYAQIAKGMWVNRTTTWASQSETTSNPNTKSLKRVNYFNITTDGAPTTDPLTCSLPVIPTNTVLPPRPGPSNSNTPTVPPPPQQNQPGGPVMPPPVTPAIPAAPIVIADGGTLVCNVTQNICTGEILKVTETNQCFLTSASDVPGRPTLLCYNDSLPTVYPKTRLTYPDAGGKWPQGAKFIAAANTTKPISSNTFNITASNGVPIQSNTSSATQFENTIISASQFENTIISAVNNRASTNLQEIKQFVTNLNNDTFTSIDNVFNNNYSLSRENTQLNNIVTIAAKTVKLYLDNKFTDLDNKLITIDASINTLESEVGAINTVVSTLESEVGAINTVVSALKSDINALCCNHRACEINESEIVANIQTAINSAVLTIEQYIDGQTSNIIASINNSSSSDIIHPIAISGTVAEIMKYYSKFAVGDFYSISPSFITEDSFNLLTSQLEQFKNSGVSTTSDYEIIRNLILTSLQSVYALINQNITYRNTLMNYDKLYNAIVKTFKTYVLEFNANQQHSDLPTVFTIDEQTRLGQLLLSNNFNPSFYFTDQEITSFIHSGATFSAHGTTSTIFDDYRTFIYLLIDTLNADINIINLNSSLTNNNSYLENYKDILTDVDKLKEYIEQNYTNFNSSLINVEFNLNTRLVINPEYVIYIQLYGIPENGIFESDKLNTIIYNIANNIPQ